MKILPPTLHLLLVAAILHQYRLESRGVVLMLLLAGLALPLHATLSERWRPWGFVLLSLAGLVLVAGVATAALVMALGALLLGLCHLPIGWGGRIALLLAVGLALTWGRAASLDQGPLWLQAAWPIAGSMFLFRLALYVHELRSRPDERPDLATTLGYFLMLPNVAFPLFPVVDFRRFRKARGVEPEALLWRRGSHWLGRGLLQLMLYRLVYHHGVLDPSTVEGSGQLIAYMLSTFLLYLRVSGQFHLIVGLLLLFGFALPETHHRYFLARSLTDFWRRINIYWKDFMTKMVFFPAHQRLRQRWGDRRALALATAAVFVATWALHALQWLWLTGRWLLAWHDGLFWAILGALVVVNVMVEDRWGRRRQLGPPSPAQRWATALRTLATFLTLTVLWSLWCTEPVALWWHLWASTPALAPSLVTAVVLLVALAWWIERRAMTRRPAPRPAAERQPLQRRLAALNGPWPRVVALALLLVLGLPAVHGRLAEPVARSLETLRASGPNTRDATLLRRGYYEELLAVGVDNPGLYQVYQRQPADWLRIDQTAAWRPRDPRDEVVAPGGRLPTPGGELVPGARVLFKRAPLSVNLHGMRDRPRQLTRIEGVGRLALLGSSHTMGSGVADDQTFTALLEARWQAAGRRRLEVLNFAVAGYSVLDDLATLERRVLAFAPDGVLEVGHTHDVGKLVRALALHLAEGGRLDDGPLATLVSASGAATGQPVSVLEHRLWAHRFELIEVLYRRLASRCHERGITPIWVLLPLLGGDDPAHDDDPATAERLLALTAAAGFEVLDLRHVYDGLAASTLRLAPWDDHPNPLAHQRIAEAVEQAILTRPWGQPLVAPAERAGGPDEPPPHDPTTPP